MICLYFKSPSDTTRIRYVHCKFLQSKTSVSTHFGKLCPAFPFMTFTVSYDSSSVGPGSDDPQLRGSVHWFFLVFSLTFASESLYFCAFTFTKLFFSSNSFAFNFVLQVFCFKDCSTWLCLLTPPPPTMLTFCS